MEIVAFSSAMHSVGSPRKEFMRMSLIGSTIATPTSLHLPSSFNLAPLPPLNFPVDSSDVSVVSTINGGALYMLPTENQNLALNRISTFRLSVLMVPWKSSGTISILRNGGNGKPRNFVVAPVSGGMYSVPTSKEANIVSSVQASSSFLPIAVPMPPFALYSKSGYREMPSLQPSRVSNLTFHVPEFCLTLSGDSCLLGVVIEEEGTEWGMHFNL